MLSAFKSRFISEAPTVEALLASWPAGAAPPRFQGKPKKDLPVDAWLAKVAEACAAQKVPKTRWHEIARHYMSEDVKRKLDEVEKVMRCVSGEKWHWKWSSFGVALRSISCDPKMTEAIKMQRRSGGTWWIIGRGSDKGKSMKTLEPLPVKEPLAWFRLAPKPADKPAAKTAPANPARKVAKKVMVKTVVKTTAVSKADGKKSEPKNQTEVSASFIARTVSVMKGPMQPQPVVPPPPPPPTEITAQVPLWLVAASEAIYSLTNECSTTMTILAAVLITVGSIPSMPTISAGATVTALGSMAVGLGALLREKAIADAERR
ncbi:uncharacterized protein LAESUDRAFT_727316 [Laetiporus sulphureus 93-53]|uniref:Uncharacterized protein n=1 Tax=Laetiporus sulphureus 93-53 TaxID=1314785 RepID=A0A165DK67_9APHY|nr:uncharacterized protein LAESUDRAFT_727316 [Laetiporus sulphureus 93-53]KZT05062.1 hypothetical protein LAESUDRAFT_727316 [Laetiporus sulphureus 93-53]